MDLAESNDETPKHQPPTMSWIQLGMGSGMPAAKSAISTKKLPPKPDPNFSQADIDSAVKKISEFPMTDKDATKEGEKNQKSWDDKKKPKSRKATGPAMKKQNPLAKGSGSGKKKKKEE